jgi:hypothetical protein
VRKTSVLADASGDRDRGGSNFEMVTFTVYPGFVSYDPGLDSSQLCDSWHASGPSRYSNSIFR